MIAKLMYFLKLYSKHNSQDYCCMRILKIVLKNHPHIFIHRCRLTYFLKEYNLYIYERTSAWKNTRKLLPQLSCANKK